MSQPYGSAVNTNGDDRIVEWTTARPARTTADAVEALGATLGGFAGPVAADPDPRRALVRDQSENPRPPSGGLTVAAKSGERIPILVSDGSIRDEAGLAGGIAHDFTNVMTTINGAAALAAR